MAGKFWAFLSYFNIVYLAFVETLCLFAKANRGTTAVEYGLIVGGIAVAIIAVVFNLGEDLENVFTVISQKLQRSRQMRVI